jgi:hypothetical protein
MGIAERRGALCGRDVGRLRGGPGWTASWLRGAQLEVGVLAPHQAGLYVHVQVIRAAHES